MKHIFKAVIAAVLALLVITLMPAQVFADSLSEYISEIKIFYGDYKDAEKEGYTILNGENGKLAMTVPDKPNSRNQKYYTKKRIKNNISTEPLLCADF